MSIPVWFMYAAVCASAALMAWILLGVIPFSRRISRGRILGFFKENQAYALYEIEARDEKTMAPVIRVAKMHKATTKLGDEVEIIDTTDAFGKHLETWFRGIPKPRRYKQPT